MKSKLMTTGTVLVLTLLLLAAAYAVAAPGPQYATVPQLMNYQGVLTDPVTGELVPDGDYEMTFSLYDVATGGTSLWSETQTVTVADGLFSVLLGSVQPLALEDFTGTTYLGVQVGADPEMTPRQQVVSVAYALHAQQAVNADTVDGEHAEAFASAIHDHDDLYWSLTGNAGTSASTNFLGTTDDVALEMRVNNERALRLEPNATSPNLIAGFGGNTVTARVVGATISGGGESGNSNQVTHDFGTVGGGQANRAGCSSTVGGGLDNVAGGSPDPPGHCFATVSGGSNNAATGNRSTVGGGEGNTAGAYYSTVGGGSNNTATGGLSNTVGGGTGNTADGSHAATVGGGWVNTASDMYATVGGGGENTASGDSATVGGGFGNTAIGESATVCGGWENTVSGVRSTVGGGHGNLAAADYATIAGGGLSDTEDNTTGNRVTDNYGTVGGGGNNQAGDGDEDAGNAPHTTVSGGLNNAATAGVATVGGGQHNTAGWWYATVGGGASNTASGHASTVGGGDSNTASRGHATVGGGVWNTASGFYATVSGGEENLASGEHATISGGLANTGSGSGTTISGGRQNTASGDFTTIPGGLLNTAQGDYSLAAGRRAKAYHEGAFVWADSTDARVASTGEDQFIVRASGGVTIYTSSDLIAGATLPAGSGAWSSLSDRAAKENFAPVEGQEILALLAELPIATWNYKTQTPSIRHMGPTAQDFHTAFGVGEDDRRISTVDADGVALAAIQGLYDVMLEQEAQIAAQQQRIDDLETRGAALEARSTGSVQIGLWPGVFLVGLGLVLSLPKGRTWWNRQRNGQR